MSRAKRALLQRSETATENNNNKHDGIMNVLEEMNKRNWYCPNYSI